MTYIRKQIEVQCDYCEKKYLKDASEVKRNQKLGRLSFCSFECMGKNNTPYLEKAVRNSSKLNPSNRRDEFTGFREHLRRLQYRNKEVDLTLQDLKDIFDSQNGICPYSKVSLEFVPKKGKSNPIYTISLDRKDSNLGYIKENIQFISIAMNHLKNNMSEENMQEILTILKTLN